MVLLLSAYEFHCFKIKLSQENQLLVLYSSWEKLWTTWKLIRVKGFGLLSTIFYSYERDLIMIILYVKVATYDAI